MSKSKNQRSLIEDEGSEDLFRFTFAENTKGELTVSKMFEFDDGRFKFEKTRGSVFELQQNEAGDVTDVLQTKKSRGEVEFKSYSDKDGDGIFSLDFEVEVATSAKKAEKHKFVFDENGDVTREMELKGKRWKTDRIDADEDYDVVDVDGVSYVIKTSVELDKIEFEIMRDDNGDGIYAKVLEGEGLATSFTDELGNFDMSTVQDYLALADTVVG